MDDSKRLEEQVSIHLNQTMEAGGGEGQKLQKKSITTEDKGRGKKRIQSREVEDGESDAAIRTATFLRFVYFQRNKRTPTIFSVLALPYQLFFQRSVPIFTVLPLFFSVLRIIVALAGSHPSRSGRNFTYPTGGLLFTFFGTEFGRLGSVYSVSSPLNSY